jgi:hypothetical protein
MVSQNWQPNLTTEEALLIPSITVVFALFSAMITHFITREVTKPHIRTAITFAVTFVLFCIEAMIDFFLGNKWALVFPTVSELGEIVAITFAISLLSSVTIHFVREWIEKSERKEQTRALTK